MLQLLPLALARLPLRCPVSLSCRTLLLVGLDPLLVTLVVALLPLDTVPPCFESSRSTPVSPWLGKLTVIKMNRCCPTTRLLRATLRG